MTIGALRRRYSIRSRSTARDGRGERAQTYTEKFVVWGEPPREGSTSIGEDVGALRSEETLRFRIRFRENVNIGDQAVDVANGRVYYIRSVADVAGPYRHYLQIVAAQQPAEGT